MKKIKRRGKRKKKKLTHLPSRCKRELPLVTCKLERGRSKRKRGKYPRGEKNNDITDGLKPLEANLLVTLKLARQVRK